MQDLFFSPLLSCQEITNFHTDKTLKLPDDFHQGNLDQSTDNRKTLEPLINIVKNSGLSEDAVKIPT